jgi:hypothetical protein
MILSIVVEELGQILVEKVIVGVIEESFKKSPTIDTCRKFCHVLC